MTGKETTNNKKSTGDRRIEDATVIDKVQLFASRSEVKEVVDEACQHIHESTITNGK